MKKKKIISKPPKEVKECIEAILHKNHPLILKKLTLNNFRFTSRKNFGNISMIEKEYYSIKGKFSVHNNQTEVSYEVKGNATFRIFSIVLPIMMLPSVIIGLTNGDKSSILISVIVYFLVVGVMIIILLNQEKKLTLKGESQFKNLLNDVISM